MIYQCVYKYYLVGKISFNQIIIGDVNYYVCQYHLKGLFFFIILCPQ